MRRYKQGFTLIEVLAAVAIVAFMVPALMLLMMQQTDYAGVLRDKTIANWIAQNKANELRLERIYLNQLLERESVETVEMAGTEWEVKIAIKNTLEGSLILYRIQVNHQHASRDAQPLITLETYLHAT